MGAIADVLQCDPSMATWLIDRLEERRLVERKMLTTDRRVKIVSLTRRGVRVKTKVLAHLLEPPPELLTPRPGTPRSAPRRAERPPGVRAAAHAYARARRRPASVEDARRRSGVASDRSVTPHR